MAIARSSPMPMLALLASLGAVPVSFAASPGLPFAEDFSTGDLRDGARTTAEWSVEREALLLARSRQRYGVYPAAGSPVLPLHAGGLDFSALAVGDVDGDGDRDVVLGISGGPNLYVPNAGVPNPFGSGGSAVPIGADADSTSSLALGDVDGDGDLDLVAGNYTNPAIPGAPPQVTRLYRNNGSPEPFAGAVGEPVGLPGDPTTSVALGDVDGDGDLDLVVGNSGAPSRVVRNEGGVFGPAAEVGGGPQPTSAVALADLDGDGRLDLVAGNGSFVGATANRLYLNDGTGEPFRGPGAAITSDAFITLDVALGDVNGDGHVDLLAADWTSRIRLYANNGTSAPFDGAVAAELDAGTHFARSLALGDVDGDGDLDLVSGSSSDETGHKVRLHRNNGTRNPFQGVAPQGLASGALGSYTVPAVALGDLDADGDPDIVALHAGYRALWVPNGGTANPFEGVTAADVGSEVQATRDAAVADFDGDGDPDVAVGNMGRRNRLFLSNGSGDPFAGAPGTDIGVEEDETRCVAAGDVDGDGDVDLVVGNDTLAAPNRVYLNNGTPSPFAGVVPRDLTADRHYTTDIALADFDGDGDLDAVAGNRTFFRSRLYLNNGTGDPFAGVAGTDLSADVRTVEALAVGDVDGDGDLDLVSGNYAEPNRLYRNSGTSAPFASGAGEILPGGGGWTGDVLLADLDGDGDLDLVEALQDLPKRLYRNDGTGRFDAGVDIGTDAHDTRSLAAADLDRDGDLDLVAGNHPHATRIYLNNGTADPFAGAAGLWVSSDAYDTYAVVAADLDRDGQTDVFTGNSNGTNRWYRNQGWATSFAGIGAAEVTADNAMSNSLDLGDVDGDGDVDLVVGNGNLQPDRLYLNNGSSEPFAGAVGVDLPSVGTYTKAVALGDLDRDGDLDLVVGNQIGQVNRLFLNNGTAAPFEGVTGAAIGTDALSTQAVALGDVDGDGDLDLVTGDTNHTNRLYRNNGTADPFAGVVPLDASVGAYSTRDILLADMDGDGDLDLVEGIWNAPSRLYLNDGSATPFAGNPGTPISNDAYLTMSLSVRDVDRDGDLDLVVGNSNGPVRLYRNNGTADPFGGVAGTTVVGPQGNTFPAIALGDVDADGDLDLLALFGQPNLLFLNNGSSDPFAGVAGTPAVPDEDRPDAVRIADVDGDGQADLVAVYGLRPNRLYRRDLRDTAKGTAVSLRVDGEVDPILAATLTPAASVPPNTWVAYYLSNDGGLRYHRVAPGAEFPFPGGGADLRWRAELGALSPLLTPWVDQVRITATTVPLSAPEIVGQSPVETREELALTIDFSMLTVFDPDSVYPEGFTLEVFDGPNYARSGATIVPARDFFGELRVPVRVSDGRLASAPYELRVAVTPVNDPPVAWAGSVAATEDSPAAGELAASDAEGDALTYALAQAPALGSVTVDPASGRYTYTPLPDANGTDSFRFRAWDGQASSGPAEIRVVISPVNDPPRPAGAQLSTAEDRTGSTTILAGDPDEGDACTWTLEEAPVRGTAEVTPDGVVTYTPAPDYHGGDALVVRATDAAGASAAISVAIEVLPVNDPPVISGTPPSEARAGETYRFAPVARDADGDVLVFSARSAPAWAAFDSATGVLSGTPGPADAGTTEGVEIAVTDGIDTVALPRFDVTVSASTDNVSASGSGGGGCFLDTLSR